MNVDMFRPENETEDLLLSITRNCEKFKKQIHKKHKKHYKLSLPNQRKPSHSDNPLILVLTLNG